MKLFLALIGAALAVPAPAQEKAAAAALTIKVLQSSAGSLYSNTTLIEGARDAVLVDPPFTMADAHRVVAMVLESGKHLTTIFVTHDHPDHYFSVEVIQDAFPDAKVVANPTVVADIWASLPFKVKRWGPVLGGNGPRHPSAPSPLVSDTIMLEGQALKVLGPMQGDHVHATALWAPSIKALVGGDLIFNRMHLWLGEHDGADVAAWRAALDNLAALKPEIVVAGHAKPGMPNDASGLDFTRRYLAAWPGLVAAAKDSADLQAKVKAAFPDTIDALDGFILPNSAKVAKGEEPKWQE